MFVLIANSSAADATVTVRLMFEGSQPSVARDYVVAPRARRTVWINSDFPSAQNRRFSVVVESRGYPSASLVVEQATYSNADNVRWAAGSATLGTALPPSEIEFAGEPGDYISQGRHYIASSTNGALSASRNFDNGVSFRWLGSTNWSVEFAAPNDGVIVPGTYTGATRFPFQQSSVPGLSVSGDGRGCNELQGSFTVHEAIYGSTGEVNKFVAEFEQRCENNGPPLWGSVHYERGK